MFTHLTAPSADRIKESMGNLLQFLQMTAQISGAHTVEFYTQDVWKNLVAVSPESVLSIFSQQQKPHYEDKEAPDMSRIFSPATNQLVNLESFVEAAHYNSLMNLGLCTPIEEIFKTFALQSTNKLDKEIKTDQFMNDKKSHEVAVMSQFVEALANVYGLKQVIDLGAGKGYLSSYLSMRYDLKVYGIDSSHTNTDGATERNRKLKKYWQVYKTDARTSSKAKKSDQKKEALLPKNSCQDVSADQDISRQTERDIRCTRLSNSESCKEEDMSQFTDSSKWPSNKESNEAMENTHTDNSSDSAFSFLDILPAGAVEVPSVSQSVSKVLSEQEKEQRKMENIKAKKLPETHVYSPLTSYVTADTELHDIITDLEESIMVGLHTCGDLAPNTLRIFTSKPEIKAVCSVGCCYHFLSEEFDHQEEGLVHIAAILQLASRVPLFPQQNSASRKYVHSKNEHVPLDCIDVYGDHNDGHLSLLSLALERVAVGQGLPSESLFYRAVLQVLCKEVYGITQSDQRVGKIFSKSTSFTDYVRKSLKKFGQDDSKLSDHQIMEYYQKYELRRNELEAFNRLKVFLAPCIEALILLDRLSYLREQENIAWSGLVKLFDPVKSPRCYAVVALKQL